jgi:hypothetical protein
MESLFKTWSTNYYDRQKRALEISGMFFSWYNVDGLSCDNEYIPIYAPKINKGIYNRTVIHYSIPKFSEVSVVKNYPQLYDKLASSSAIFIFQTKAMESPITGFKGVLFKTITGTSNIEILFLLAVKTEYAKKMYSNLTLQGISKDLSNFAIFMSKDFYTSDAYKSIRSKFLREVVNPLIDKGVEIVITNNIEERCFKNKVKLPKFKTVTELKEFLDSFNNVM